ncbi:MAG: sensor histidine kinase [Spirochaetaceae bacterium]|nr:MAG: sensor histidine kinase [Spirochaetaceae bacterium]
MNSLFGRILIAFVLTFLLMYGTAAAVLFSGYYRSLSVWSAERVASVENAVGEVLETHEPPLPAGPRDEVSPGALGLDERLVGIAVPVFVYDTEGQLIASNRGAGRRRETEGTARAPVYDSEGSLLGYYATVAAQFHQDEANRALLDSLVHASLLGGLAALSVALATAFALSRMLAGPARQVAAGIDSLSNGLEDGLDVPNAVPEIGTTEIARIARATNSLVERLRGERRIRAQWSQDLAHDLRSPVASIRAQLEAVLDGVYRADPERIGSTLRELARVEGLVEDLEELMRLEEPELKVSLSTIDSRQFLDSLSERFNHEVVRKELRLELHSDVPEFTADEDLLYRAASNLLSNAIRHTDHAGTICVQVHAQSNSVCFDVVNSGTPIPDHDLPHLFDRLYRGEYARNSVGSGLGLTIARRIVLLHGGSISIESGAQSGTVENGTRLAGTTVRMTLPQA